MSSNKSLTSSGGLHCREENTQMKVVLLFKRMYTLKCYWYSSKLPRMKRMQMLFVRNRLVNDDHRASLQLTRWCLFLRSGLVPSSEAMFSLKPNKVLSWNPEDKHQYNLMSRKVQYAWNRCVFIQLQLKGISLFGTICGSIHSSAYCMTGCSWLHIWGKENGNEHAGLLYCNKLHKITYWRLSCKYLQWAIL